MTFRTDLILSLLMSFTAFYACEKDDTPPTEESPILNLPEVPYDYETIDLPGHLTTNVLLGPGQNAATDNDNTPTNNPVTDEGATLGRVLF